MVYTRIWRKTVQGFLLYFALYLDTLFLKLWKSWNTKVEGFFPYHYYYVLNISQKKQLIGKLKKNNQSCVFELNSLSIIIDKIKVLFAIIIQGILIKIHKTLIFFPLSDVHLFFLIDSKDAMEKIIQLLYLKFFPSFKNKVSIEGVKYKRKPCTHFILSQTNHFG